MTVTTARPDAPASRRRNPVVGFLARPEALLVALLIAALILGMQLSPHFLTGSNLSNASQNLMEKAVMLLPVTALVICGEIDLSIASILGLSGSVLAVLVRAGVPIIPAIVAVLALGVICGLLNGVLVTAVGLPSLVVTLGTLSLYRGVSYMVLGGASYAGFPSAFTTFGFDYIPGTLIPWSALVFVGLAVIAVAVLTLTPIGRIIYAAGSNGEAVRFSGIPVDRIKITLFASSGFCAAIAGVVYTARVASARADNATGFELDVIAAILIGGVSVFGGRGTIGGAILGLFLIGLLRNALTLRNISAEVQSVVVGGLLIGSVLVAHSSNLLRPLRRRRHRASAPTPP